MLEPPAKREISAPSVHAAVRHPDLPRALQLKGLLLFGAKHGDNEQVRALAKALNLAAENIRLKFNCLHIVPNILFSATPINLHRDQRQCLDTLGAPDVIITSGKRSYRAARYLKKKSGGNSVWIHIGRPWGPFEAIDLIVTTPQYRLPSDSRVLQLPYPITKPGLDTLPASSDLKPDPCVAAIIGGSSTSHIVDSKVFKEVILSAHALAEAYEYPLRVITSPRTPTKLLKQVKTLPAEFARTICWRHHRTPPGTTPYQFALRDGRAFVVTSDSASMMAEAIESGQPVFIIPARKRLLTRFSAALSRVSQAALCYLGCLDRARVILDWLVVRGVYTPSRDMQKLIDSEINHLEHSVILTQEPIRVISCRKGSVASPLALAVGGVKAMLNARQTRISGTDGTDKLSTSRRFAR